MFKLETERPGRGRSSSSGLSDFSSRTREVELEHEVKRLKQVAMKSSLFQHVCGDLKLLLSHNGQMNVSAGLRVQINLKHN